MRLFQYKNIIVILIGIIVLVSVNFSLFPEDMPIKAQKVAAVGFIMSLFWVTEVIPISVTALFPLVLFPVMNVASLQESGTGFSNPLIFLFLGGFFLALALEKWELHKRFALNIIKFIGVKPKLMVLGFFVSTGLISMWINNTSTTLMMLPIALSTLQLMEKEEIFKDENSKENYNKIILLIIAYAASVGGISTLIGTTPNIFMYGFIKQELNISLSFWTWMKFGIPLFLISIPIFTITLIKVFPFQIKEEKFKLEELNQEIVNLGKLSKAELAVIIVFGIVVSLWMVQPIIGKSLPYITDSTIAIAGGIILFLIPIDRYGNKYLMDWKTAEKLPWDALLLFGGGLSLAKMIDQSGLAEWMGIKLSILSGLNIWFLLFIIIVMIIFLTELTSNIATTATFLPILLSLAKAVSVNPLFFIIPATVAASCAFMLPIATPPNTIIFGSGRIKIKDMVRAGLILNLIYIFLIEFLVYFLGSEIFSIP